MLYVMHFTPLHVQRRLYKLFTQPNQHNHNYQENIYNKETKVSYKGTNFRIR